MSSDSRDVAYAIFFFGFGIVSFFKGFKRLRRKRMIENIPTSTVRGLAMGLVELVGEAKKMAQIKAPLTGTECVFYRYTVERYQKSGKSGRWVIIAKGDSFSCPFWLDDRTGKVIVLPKGAELVMSVDYAFSTRGWSTLPENLVRFMQENHLSYKGFLGNHSLRFKEWHICENEVVYVLGTAKAAGEDNYLDNYKQTLYNKLEELKSNPQEMTKIDTNQDGEISQQEWDQAVSRLEQQLLEKGLSTCTADKQTGVLVTKGETNKIFILSDHGQKELIEKFSWLAFGGVFGGAALSLAMLAYLLLRFRMFSF